MKMFRQDGFVVDLFEIDKQQRELKMALLQARNAEKVEFDATARCFTFTMTNGLGKRLFFPDLVDRLKGASTASLAKYVTYDYFGSIHTIEWPKLNVSYYISELIPQNYEKFMVRHYVNNPIFNDKLKVQFQEALQKVPDGGPFEFPMHFVYSLEQKTGKVFNVKKVENRGKFSVAILEEKK